MLVLTKLIPLSDAQSVTDNNIVIKDCDSLVKVHINRASEIKKLYACIQYMS